MVREYVGARYVPKFMGTHDVTQQYEALCVVDNGMGTSYISKIPTPAGTPLTNTTYWAVYGAASGAIINLQNQIDNIENVEIPDINLNIQNLTNSVASNTDNINKLKNHNILLMGDSFGYGVITSGVFATKGWIEYASDYLNSIDNVNCYYLLSSQASIAGNNGFASSYPFTTELQDFRTANPNVDIDEIFVFAGTNDIVNTSGIATGIANFCTLARTYYGDEVNINIGTIGTIIYDIYSQIVPLYKQGCIDNKCNFMGKLTNLYSDVSLHYSPNAHLSQAGYDFYNPYVLNYILNGDISYKFTFPLNITPEATNVNIIGNNPTFYMIVTQDYTKISIVALESPFTGFFIEPVNKINLNAIQSDILLGTIASAPQTIADNETLLNFNILMGDTIAANGRIYKRGDKLYIENTLKFPSITYDSSMSQYIVYGYQEHTQIV